MKQCGWHLVCIQPTQMPQPDSHKISSADFFEKLIVTVIQLTKSIYKPIFLRPSMLK